MVPRFNDCQAINISSFIDTLLSKSINSVCASEDDIRMTSPVEKFKKQPTSRTRSDKGILDVSGTMVTQTSANRSKSHIYRHSQSLPANLTSSSSFRNRKPSGLSISSHDLATVDLTNPQTCPAPIYCARNVEMRRKSLSERHFFRPVSEDDESEITAGQ